MRIRADWVVWTAALVWGGLLTGFAVHGFVHPRSHTVFDIYGPAARDWWAGRDLYAPTVKDWWEGAEVHVTTTDYYRYSPLFAIAVTPFGLLPENLGNPLWKVFNIAVYAAGLWVAARRLFPVALGRTQVAALFLLVLTTSLQSMYIGQANLIVVGAILLGLAAATEDRWNQSAAWLALATLVKGYPLALALLLAVLFPRRFSWRFAAALGVGLLLPFATQRPEVVVAQNRSWVEHLRASTEIMRERLYSVDKLFEVGGLPLTPAAFSLFALAGGGIVLGLCLLHSRHHPDRRACLTGVLALFSAWVVLFGPATEACTYVVVAPSLAWAVLDAFRRPGQWGRRLLLLASLLLMGPLVTDLFGSTVRTWAHRWGSQPMGGLLFLGYLAVPILTAGSRSVLGRPATPLAFLEKAS